MNYLGGSNFASQNNNDRPKVKFYKKKWFKILAVLVGLFLIIGGAFAWKTGNILNKISKGGLFNSLAHVLPGINNKLKGEEDGRVNLLLMGMRGENVPGGGTLADTIMLFSILPKENKLSIISIPRDLYVDNPVWSNKTKINAVYAAGEENDKKQGIQEMEKVVGDIAGLSINYGVSINFQGFKQLIDAIGGIQITLEKDFDEAVQFNEPHVCNSFFTIPTGKWQNKIKSSHTVITNGVARKVNVKVPMYPLCTAPLETLECGGSFKLSAGTQTLNGEQALCYARSRATSNDFERAKRQQQIIKLVENKLLSAGTLMDFGKLNGVLNSLGDNVRSDLQPWEMKRFYDLYTGMKNTQISQRVLENTTEGLLYNPTNMPKEVGYILLPIGDNYDKIREMAKNIFNLPPQTDIQPK